MGILAARKETASNSTTTVRQFRVPKLNFEAEDYTELVDWQSIDRYSPPVMKEMSDSEIIAFVECRVTDKVDYPRFPCHTQGTCTERCIKLVMQASAAGGVWRRTQRRFHQCQIALNKYNEISPI